MTCHIIISAGHIESDSSTAVRRKHAEQRRTLHFHRLTDDMADKADEAARFEDFIHRTVERNVHLINLVQCEKDILPEARAERVRKISSEIRKCMAKLRSEDGKARDKEYYGQEGNDSLSMAATAHAKWCDNHQHLFDNGEVESISAVDNGGEVESISGSSQEEAQTLPPPSPLVPSEPPVSPPREPQPELELEVVSADGLATESETESEAQPSPLDLAIETNNNFEAAIEDALLCDESQEGHTHHMVAERFDPCTPALLVVCDVVGARGLQAARRSSFNDIIAAGSRYGQITQTKNIIGPIARSIATLRAKSKANADYGGIDHTKPVCVALNSVEESEQVDVDAESEIGRLSSQPHVVAASAAAKRIGKNFMQIAKSGRHCQTQDTIITSQVVCAKTFVQITFDVWVDRCGRDDWCLFQRFRQFSEKTYGGKVGSLTLDLIVSKVLVEASFQQLSADDQRTAAEFASRLKRDISSTAFLAEVQIAESDPLILSNPDQPWKPPVLSTPLTNPHFGRNDGTGQKRRRIMAKHFFYTMFSRLFGHTITSFGFPEERVLDLSLAVLCTAATKIDEGKYGIFMSSPSTVRSKAPVLLKRNGDIDSILNAFDTKTTAFRNNYEFMDIAPDLLGGTTKTLDVVSAFLDRAFAVEGNDVVVVGESNRDNGAENEEQQQVQI